MLISPGPGGDGSADGGDQGLQETLDWVHDLYNTFCKPIQAESRADPGMAGTEEWDGTTMPEGDGTIPPMDAPMDGTMSDDAAKAAADQVNEMLAAGMTPDQIAEMMANGESGEWDENMDDASWAKLWRLHTMLCDGILQTHTEVSKWNDADEAGKKEMEDKLGEELADWLQDLFDGAVGSFALASTAVAAGVAVLAF